MNSLTIRRSLRAMSVVFAACLAFAAHGSANVFDDAVFWFRGGKDINGNGYMQSGEFFDDLHANDDSHPNHQMLVTKYSGSQTGPFRENAVFRNEQVVFPSLGASIAENMQVLHISNIPQDVNGTSYCYPLGVNPHTVFNNNNISNEYTIVSRIRMEDLNRTECFFKLGYDSSARKGLMFGFDKKDSGSKYIMGYRTPNSTGSNERFDFNNIRIPTNTWVDVAVVVGNGNLRVGVALPVSGGNPTIVFAETPMWTDNCPLLESGKYMLFGQKSEAKEAGKEDKFYFLGSVQQVAIWRRALSDQEVMAAFGMPRPAIFRTGFDNGSSDEFGGGRSGSSQTIGGLGSWQGVWDELHAGDTWTVNFNALRDESGLAQIFSLGALPSSASAAIEVKLNGTSLGTRRVQGGGRVFWPVAASLVGEGANALTIRRVDSDAGSFRMDAMELGGSLGIGTLGDGYADGRVAPDRNPTGVPSAADPNLQHWSQGLQPYTGASNVHFRVWVDPDVVGKANFRLSMRVKCEEESEHSLTGDETASLCVNGIEKISHGAVEAWRTLEPDIARGELRAGWNDIEFKSPDKTCHWLVAYYRFETILLRGFSLPPPGMAVIIR